VSFSNKIMTKINQVLSIIVTSFLFISGCGSGFDSGDGKKIGQIVKIGEHGVFCSTYEAEIIRGGFSGGSGVNGLALDFTIKNKKLYEALVVSMENQQEIELSYDKRAFSGPCYSDSAIIATGFRVLNSEKEVLKEVPVIQSQSEWRSEEHKSDDTLIIRGGN
jgi:hypothetical protein